LSYEVRRATPEDFPAALHPIFHYFGRLPDAEWVERVSSLLPLERIHAVFDNGAVVGSASAFPFEIGIPGGFARAAGVTMVGVLPTHRRRGIFNTVMRAQLEDIHEQGESIAYLWASDDALYGRFGYGIASLSGNIEISRDRAAFHGQFEPRGRLRLVEVDEAVAPFSEIQRRVAAEHPGMFVRTEEWWRNRRLTDPEESRDGGGEMVRALLELDGRPAAYALYRLNFSADRGVPRGFTSVVEAMGDSDEATREIWRYLLDIDWMERVRAGLLPLDHELFLLLQEPRRLSFNLRDGLWVRLVDVETALAARSYKPGEAVVLQLADELCPWNDGAWEIGPDGVARTTRPAEISLNASALGSAYLGGFGFGQLARAGRVEQLVDGALERADALFRADRYPWCPEIF